MRRRDTRPYITVHDGMPDHPKIEGLSDAAFRLLVTTWCWCNRNRTDGEVREASWSKRGTRKARQELIDVGLAELTSTGVQMHDYLQHQRSAEEIDELSEKRRTAGSKGGNSTASRSASATANAAASATAKSAANGQQRRSKTAAEQPISVNSSTSTGSPTVAAGTIPNIIRLYVESARDAGVAAPEEAQAKVDRSARSLLSQGYDAHAVEDAARNAAVNGWTDLAIQLQRDTARASPPTGTNGSTSDKRHRDALALADQLEQKAIG